MPSRRRWWHSKSDNCVAEKEQSRLVFDGFSVLTGGMDSGIAPLSLTKDKFAYGTNTTVRGGYITHRPGYQLQNLLLNLPQGFALANQLFQTATYYKPDFGSESIVAMIGGRIYQFIPDTTYNMYVYDRTIQEVVVNNIVEEYDTNPATLPQGWSWQSENYVIFNNGVNRSIIFNGISSRRAVTPSFVGTVTESFVIPAVGASVNIILSGPYLDAIGQFIQVSPLDYYPFLMQVTAVNGSTVMATNIDGWSAAGQIVPILAPVESVSNPTYFTTVLGMTLPAQGSPVTFGVATGYTGAVGDTLLLTDGTGPLTTIQLTVTAFTGGSAPTITATNVTGLSGYIVPDGSPLLSQSTVPAELPVGRMGAYVEGRNWISLPSGTEFIASDQVGDSSGTQQYNFRDAVLKWSINTTEFPIPGGAGQINCIIALSALDASLGQGPLQILCDNDVFTCSAPDNAALWATTTTPILFESIIGWGGTGQNAAAVVNTDLITKSDDGTIHSLRLTRDDFNEWGNLPISKEVNRIIMQENDDLLSYITAAAADNRLLMSCAPIDSGNGVYSQGLIALDYDVTSSLQGKLPSVYDGVWKDLNALQVVTGIFNNVARAFAFCLNTATNTVEVWEILTLGTADGNFKTTIIPPVTTTTGTTVTIPVAGITYTGTPDPTATVNVTPGTIYTITPGVNENGMVLVNGSQVVTLATGTPVTITAQGATILFQYPNLVPVGATYHGGIYSVLGQFLSPNTNYNLVFGTYELEFENAGTPATLTASGSFNTGPTVGVLLTGMNLQPVTALLYVEATGLTLTATITSGMSVTTTTPGSSTTVPIQVPIDWSFETAVMFQDIKEKGKFDPIKLEGGEVYVSDLVGSATLSAWYRPDFDECWHPWRTVNLCADNSVSTTGQYRIRVGLGKPDEPPCDPTVNKSPRDGRFFQFRFEITGHLVFMNAIFAASIQPQVLLLPPFTSEGTT
jgi:hypothetical protein